MNVGAGREDLFQLAQHDDDFDVVVKSNLVDGIVKLCDELAVIEVELRLVQSDVANASIGLEPNCRLSELLRYHSVLPGLRCSATY